MVLPFTINTGSIAETPRGRDLRYKRTLQFFVTKGYLANAPLSRPYRGKLTLADVLWTCANVAGELYEVLPAALMTFPNHLPGPLPPDLRRIIDRLGSGATDGPSYRGHAYQWIQEWTKFQTKDGRVSGGVKRRVHLLVPLDVAARLRAAAKRTGRSQGNLVAAAIRSHLDQC